jgi:hypothetical protein
MKLDLHTKSRDNLYEASASYNNGVITVLCGSHINMVDNPGFHPSAEVAQIRQDRTSVTTDGILIRDIDFTSLSTAASFVTGRVANGMMVWKTDDGKYVRYSLAKEKEQRRQ